MKRYWGMVRVRNEQRWITQCVNSLKPLCQKVFLFDDHSTDRTSAYAHFLECHVFSSPFPKHETDEARDKNWLLGRIWEHVKPQERGPDSQDYIVCIDGDEELEAGGAAIICGSNGPALALRIVYLWDDERHVRVDGIYGRFTRGSVFQMVSPCHQFKRKQTRGPNFHCGSIPEELNNQVQMCRATLWHYGYMQRADRLRKYEFYTRMDPKNRAEDNYRHIVQGDLPEIPPEARLMHAGPLELCARGN